MNYINNTDFQAEIVNCINSNIISDKLTKMFILLIDNIYTSFYTPNMYEHDIKTDVLLKCISNINKLNVNDYDNPFAFFTTYIKRHCINYYKKYNRKDKMVYLSEITSY